MCRVILSRIGLTTMGVTVDMVMLASDRGR
jgi:hypothetical protein